MDHEVSNWIEQASADFKAAKDMLTTQNYSASVVFSQQCAEKALKAVYISLYGKIPPKIHDLVELCRLVKASNVVLRHAELLTSTYFSSRYPGAGPEIPARYYTTEKAIVHLQEAEVIFSWAQKRIE